MKKLFSSLAFMFLCVLASCHISTAHAAVGDVIGHIYSSDIKAYIEDFPIRSFNIGGKTAIVIEDLADYGFKVKWEEYSPRSLDVWYTENELLSNPGYKHPEGVVPGKVIGNIYETDIDVSFFDMGIPSYNIGGLTAVTIEDLGMNHEDTIGGSQWETYVDGYSDYCFKAIWDEQKREIHLDYLAAGDVVNTDLGKFEVCKAVYSSNHWGLWIGYTCNDINKKFYSLLEFVPIDSLAKVLGFTYEASDGNITLDFTNAVTQTLTVQTIPREYYHSRPSRCFWLSGTLCIDGKSTYFDSRQDTPPLGMTQYGSFYINPKAIEQIIGRTLFVSEETGESPAWQDYCFPW